MNVEGEKGEVAKASGDSTSPMSQDMAAVHSVLQSTHGLFLLGVTVEVATQRSRTSATSSKAPKRKARQVSRDKVRTRFCSRSSETSNVLVQLSLAPTGTFPHVSGLGCPRCGTKLYTPGVASPKPQEDHRYVPRE